MTRVQADIMLLVVTFAAAAGWLFSKSSLAQIQPFWFIGIRFLLAGFVLALFCFNELKQLSSKELSKGLLTGLLFALAMMIWIAGLDKSHHVGEASFIVSLGVMFVPLFSLLLLKERLSASLWLSIPLAIAGLASLNLQSGWDNALTMDNSQLLLLLAAICFALQFTVTAKFARSMSPLPLTCLQLFTAGSIASLIALFTETLPVSFSNELISNILAAAIIASSLRFYMQTQALKYSQASYAGMILLLEPVWVTLMAYFAYDQSLNKYQLIGCTLIFTALLFNRISTIMETNVQQKPS